MRSPYYVLGGAGELSSIVVHSILGTAPLICGVLKTASGLHDAGKQHERLVSIASDRLLDTWFRSTRTI